MKFNEENKRKKLILGIVVTAVIVAVIVFAWYFFIKSHTKYVPSTEGQASEQPTEPVPVKVASTVLFTGNTYWGRFINRVAMASDLKYAYPFSGLDKFERDTYDAWITGLECPTVAGLNLSADEEEATLSFNCSPNYLPEAAKWFDIVTLANNHTDNQGSEGFSETREHLDKNGIQYFGHYDPEVLKDICEVVSLPVQITYSDDSVKKHHLPVAMCGYHGVFKIPSAEAIALMEEYSKYMPVIAMPHMGAEYQSAPDQLKRNTYRAMIDHGADMVIGDHPHWIQSTEAYKGKLIVYSMGNFIFDQQFNKEVARSAAIKMVMSAQVDDAKNLSAWLALGEKCKAFHDSCLEDAQKDDLQKLSLNYQFGVIGTNNDGADKIVKPATAAQQAEILQRLNWSTTINGLRAPESGL